MKKSFTFASKSRALAAVALVGIAAIELAAPSAMLAQGSGEARRERRRDALQETFTGWDQLGSAPVSSDSGDVTIQVASGARARDRVRLRVESASLTLDHLRVTYVGGERYEATAALAFSSDHRSHEIDLPGTARAIQQIEFHVSNVPAGQTSQVELWSR